MTLKIALSSLAAGILIISAGSAQVGADQPRPAQVRDRLDEWLAAVEAHEPGNPGKAAIEVSTWTGDELEEAVANARRHAQALAQTDLDAANRLLLRGAALHADIARLIPTEITRRSPRQLSVYTVVDGRWQSVRYITMHWRLGRQALDSIQPSPAGNPEVLSWYRQTSHDLMDLLSNAEAIVHLARARQIFPTDSSFLFFSGLVHERFSSPMLQAGAESLVDDGRGETTVGSVKAELGRAERFFRDALTHDPRHLEARVRYGHTLGRLGRHAEAAVQLRKAIADGAAGDLEYLAQLILGREEEAIGNLDTARTAYERAAGLRPNAQTPRLALSFLARRTGNRAAAQRELQTLAGLPDAEARRDDPWWKYFSLR